MDIKKHKYNRQPFLLLLLLPLCPIIFIDYIKKPIPKHPPKNSVLHVCDSYYVFWKS